MAEVGNSFNSNGFQMSIPNVTNVQSQSITAYSEYYIDVNSPQKAAKQQNATNIITSKLS